MVIVAKEKRNTNLIIVILLIVFISIDGIGVEKNKSIVYVLQWLPSSEDTLIEDIEDEQKAFYKRKCKFLNCYVTTNRSLLHLGVRDFDVILFNVVNIVYSPLPSQRKPTQIYIFYAMDSAATNRIPKKFDNYFNLTWTYRLDSDIPTPYIIVTNKVGDVMGPKMQMNWKNIDSMKPTKESIKIKLKNKTLAVAWIVTNCRAKNRRIRYVEELQKELLPYGLTVDIYGCDYLRCPKDDSKEGCYAIIDKYYFYLVFENWFCEDYVTTKVLHAINHYAVPVVYGGADYSRFLPEGSYLNARDLNVRRLAIEIVAIIRDKQRYYNFFKWHRYYNFSDAFKDKHKDGICDFCAVVNNNMKLTNVHKQLSVWWNGPLTSHLDPMAAKNMTKNLRSTPVNFNKISSSTEATAPEESDFVGTIISKVVTFFTEK